MTENTQKSQKNSDEKKHNTRARRLRKPSALLIWIVIEAVAVLAIAVAAIIKNVYGESITRGSDYTVPAQETSEVSIDDIELPTDLTADQPEDEEAVVGDTYNMDYSEEVLTTLSQMDNRQKICALLVTTPEALTGKSNVTIAGDVFSESYAADPVAGLFFADSNFTSEAAGMEMLATIRGWSRDISGMNILLGYSGEMKDPLAQSDRGLNMFALTPDMENASELSASAADNHMLPARFVTADDALSDEDMSGLRVVATDDAAKIIEVINDGKPFMYMTGDYRGVADGLLAAADDMTIAPEALDSAAGYALSMRETLTQIRPEDIERIPPEEEAPKPEAKKSDNKKKEEPKKMTPEEEAAAALAALQKQAEDAAKAAQKQLEDAAKAAQKQAEEAAKAAQGQ